jgi:hypothetical protein
LGSAARRQRSIAHERSRWRAAFAGIGLGAMNKVVEFIATFFLGTNVGGYRDTGFDLVYNTVGAVLAACVIARPGGGGEAKDYSRAEGT